jgi:hypothetical protein
LFSSIVTAESKWGKLWGKQTLLGKTLRDLWTSFAAHAWRLRKRIGNLKSWRIGYTHTPAIGVEPVFATLDVA